MIQKRVADAATPSSNTLLALACIAVWVTAAASTSLFGIWLAIGGAAVALGTAVLVVDGAASRAILQPNSRRMLIGVAAGGLIAVATYLLYPVISRAVPFIASDISLLYSSFRAPSPVVVWFALAPVILGEELVWRGVIQTAAVRRAGTWGGVLLASGAYALVHAPVGSPTLVLVALPCGLCWGTLRAATGSLVPTLGAHLVWDVLVLLWLPLDLR